MAHRNRVRVAQLMLGGFHPSFGENGDLLVFGGVWALGEIPGPNRQKNCPIFRCGFKKCVFVKKGAIFFRFRPLVLPIGAVRTKKTQPFSGQKKSDLQKIEKHAENLFLVAVSNHVFSSKTERVSRFFSSFSALGAPF